MSDQRRLIRAIENAITELRIRREDPMTPPEERANIDARLADLEAQLAELRAQMLGDAAIGGELAPPDDETAARMRAHARRLDNSVAQNKSGAAIIRTVDKALKLAKS